MHFYGIWSFGGDDLNDSDPFLTKWTVSMSFLSICFFILLLKEKRVTDGSTDKPKDGNPIYASYECQCWCFNCCVVLQTKSETLTLEIRSFKKTHKFFTVYRHKWASYPLLNVSTDYRWPYFLNFLPIHDLTMWYRHPITTSHSEKWGLVPPLWSIERQLISACIAPPLRWRLSTCSIPVSTLRLLYS